jgi:hypothetical protein
MVHHVDGNPQNNMHSNLVICLKGYHELLHMRTRAYEACGHADWRKCLHCEKYDNPENMLRKKNRHPSDSYYHKECRKKVR